MFLVLNIYSKEPSIENVILNMPTSSNSLPSALYNQLHSDKIHVIKSAAITDITGALTPNQKNGIKRVDFDNKSRLSRLFGFLCQNSPSLPSCLSSVLGDEKF